MIKAINAESITTNTFNAEGLRVSKKIEDEEGEVTTWYCYEYSQVIKELDSENSVAYNTYGTNLISRELDNVKVYYIYNGHGDVTGLLSSSGTIIASYYYDSFGNIVEESGNFGNPYRYAGYFYDDQSSLYNLNARFYDAKLGRFMQEDTYLGKRSDPLSLNLYSYCFNNPLIYRDPTGHIVSDADKANLSKEDQEKIQNLTNSYNAAKAAGDMVLANAFHDRAEAIRANAGYSGGADGSGNTPVPAKSSSSKDKDKTNSSGNNSSTSGSGSPINTGNLSGYVLSKNNELFFVVEAKIAAGSITIGTVPMNQIDRLEEILMWAIRQSFGTPSGGSGTFSAANIANRPTSKETDPDCSPQAQAYIQYYQDMWWEAYDRAQRASSVAMYDAACRDMDYAHNQANDIRRLEKLGLIQGKILDVPIYSQNNISDGNGSDLCWATCAAMWISYLRGSTVDWTYGIAISVADSIDPLDYNISREWQSTNSIPVLSESLGITAKQKETMGVLTMKEIQNTIDRGSPFGVLYRDDILNSGHWVLGIGYASAPEHNQLVISNNPLGGMQSIQTYNDFQSLPDGREWKWTAR